jgi:hypothetical protein
MLNRLFSGRSRPPLTIDALSIEPLDFSDFGPCECCGNMSRTVWGGIHHQHQLIAAYYVQWTLNRPDHGANFDLVLGSWDEGSSPKDRQAVSLAFRVIHGQPQFMVIDAADRPTGERDVAHFALSRAEVVGTKFAEDVYAMVDAILAHVKRIAEILTGMNTG